MSNFDTIVSEMEEENKLDSDFLTLKVGKNPLRIVSDFVKVQIIYKGKYVPGVKGSSKYMGHLTPGRKLDADEKITTQGWAWVINRETGEFKIAQFGHSILGQIMGLKTDPEYAFTEFPMPYDITISNTGDGANRYSTIAARQNTPITEEEMAQLNKKKTIKDIIGAIIEKQSKPAETTKPVVYPENEINPDDIFPDEPAVV